MYKKTLLFAGTTEGRVIAEFLSGIGINVDVCVATEYGKEVIPESQYINIILGRLESSQMKDLIELNAYDFVVDATHPFAIIVTENIQNACKDTGVEYIRVLRGQVETNGDSIMVNSYDSAVDILNESDGPILLTIGSKELFRFKDVINFKERIFARALPTIDAIEKCKDLGLKSFNMILMQGPFTTELNCAMLKQYNCKFMVTKASGDIGGMNEKIESAKSCGTTLIIVEPPKLESGMSIEKVRQKLEQYYGQ